jgi:hypothetical protein
LITTGTGVGVAALAVLLAATVALVLAALLDVATMMAALDVALMLVLPALATLVTVDDAGATVDAARVDTGAALDAVAAEALAATVAPVVLPQAASNPVAAPPPKRARQVRRERRGRCMRFLQLSARACERGTSINGQAGPVKQVCAASQASISGGQPESSSLTSTPRLTGCTTSSSPRSITWPLPISRRQLLCRLSSPTSTRWAPLAPERTKPTGYRLLA